MTGLKEQKRPNTLMEYMGFKDEDLKTQTHDEIINFISKKENLLKLIKTIRNIDSINEVIIEYPLSDKYKKYGFLDIYFEFSKDKDTGFFERVKGFIEVKSKEESFGSVVREMEYYKDTIKNISYCFDPNNFIPIIITPTKIPEHIKQFHSFTIEQVKEICS